ncbi:MAG: hypothetical protein LBN27_06680 [Prevotellaceae bacterium]|jgi:hypothetical protein|nr:hypothetical protein [Prevotellaceae bacterium]
MQNEIKILKQLNSLQTGYRIKVWFLLVVLAVVAGLIWACGVTFSAVVGIWLGYKLLRLVLRVLGLVISLFVSLVSIIILIAIISLLIF